MLVLPRSTEFLEILCIEPFSGLFIIEREEIYNGLRDKELNPTLLDGKVLVSQDISSFPLKVIKNKNTLLPQ